VRRPVTTRVSRKPKKQKTIEPSRAPTCLPMTASMTLAYTWGCPGADGKRAVYER
jgi:hypothetical protein